MATPLRWPSEAIWQEVEPTLAGFTVEVLPEVDSTNSELMRRARAGQTDPVLLVAERQTAGRGRMGRQWASGADLGAQALTFSMGLHLAPADWSGLSLAVGVAVAQSLHPDIRLKWPNDLWWHDRKLAGILIETANWTTTSSSRYVVVGIGLNIQTPAVSGFSTAPAGLAELLPGMDATQVLHRVVGPLVRCLKTFESLGFAPFQLPFNAIDALAQVPVVLTNGVQGLAQGVDKSGALRVATAQGLQLVTSSEVSVRVQHAPSDVAT
jgi:BirA family biotin operon repressor/biotin-[acetyl-CoA-carboxylase] ligase